MVDSIPDEAHPAMHAIDLLKDSANVPDRPIYALFGDDAFLRREALKAIRRRVLPSEEDGLSFSRFVGAEAGLADVMDELRTLSFFSKRRLVLVEEADPFVTAHRKELEAYTEHPSSVGVLVLSVKTWAATTKLYKLVEKAGLPVECKGPHERQLIPWLVQMAKARCQVVLEPGAAELLVELAGREVGVLVSEVEKLAVYVGTRAKIQREDVARMVGAGRIESVWKVLDAATTGKGDVALELLDGLISSGEYPVPMLSAMSSSLLKVHQAGALRVQRVELRDACQRAGIFPGAVEQTRQQHTHLGPSRVDRLPEMLLKADLDMKGFSTLTPRTILEAVLVELARPRAD